MLYFFSCVGAIVCIIVWCYNPHIGVALLALFYCYSSSHCVDVLCMLVFNSPHIDSCYVVLLALLHYFLFLRCYITFFALLHYFFFSCCLVVLFMLMCYSSCIILMFFSHYPHCSSYVATLLFSCCCSFYVGATDPATILQVPIDPTFVLLLLVLMMLLFPWLLWYFLPFLPYACWSFEFHPSLVGVIVLQIPIGPSLVVVLFVVVLLLFLWFVWYFPSFFCLV